MIVGYARVSSSGQNLDVQRSKLEAIGCKRIFEEKASGTNEARPQLGVCLEFVRAGDTLVITKLDRLARSTVHLCQIVKELERKGVQFQVIDQAIDTSTPTGRLLFHMLGAIAEFENELRKERQRDGLQKAKEKGIQFGARPKLSPAQIAELQARRTAGETILQLARDYRISEASVYRYLSK